MDMTKAILAQYFFTYSILPNKHAGHLILLWIFFPPSCDFHQITCKKCPAYTFSQAYTLIWNSKVFTDMV